MKSKKYYQELLKKLSRRKDLSVREYKLVYNKGEYLFYRIASKQIKKNDQVILIRAGIHGDEISGPIALLKNINNIIDYIHGKGLKVIIYPLSNPSGFDRGTRYNIDNDNGVAGNNDFMRYILKDGTVTDDLLNKKSYKKWMWSSDKTLKIKLPVETKLMHRLLRKDPLSQVVACIDLHQDYITQTKKALAYFYPLGNIKKYIHLVKETKTIAPIFKNKIIGAGFETNLNKNKERLNVQALRSDKNGFIIRHDGSLPDLLYRLGAKYCVTIETTGATPIKKAIEVNLVWIYGVIDLIK